MLYGLFEHALLLEEGIGVGVAPDEGPEGFGFRAAAAGGKHLAAEICARLRVGGAFFFKTGESVCSEYFCPFV